MKTCGLISRLCVFSVRRCVGAEITETGLLGVDSQRQTI